MITVSGASFDISKIENDYEETSVERQLLNTMSLSSENYVYDNIKQLKFELNMRNQIINSAVSLYRSDLSFSNFSSSKCSAAYWNRTDNGGFMLAQGVKPDEAISDIFQNGDKYATECATAIMIVYYKALLEIYESKLFNKLFSKIYLMDWDVREPLLKEVGVPQTETDILLGDRGYFNNPDFDPATPEWEGENVIVLPDSIYYGHGIGLATADEIIRALNSKRKEDSTISAYLLNSTGRPNFRKLSDVYDYPILQPVPLVWKPFPKPIITI